ncbi:SDR family NAD(P)-dependent oxidoreductase [Streptomyces cinnamoneus]
MARALPRAALPLQGRRILVTGGTRGIGRAVTLAAARAGARVVAAYHSDARAAATLAEELGPGHPAPHTVRGDTADPEAVDEMVAVCHDRLGGLDGVVVGAGVISHHPYGRLPLEEWQRVLATNLTGAHLVLQKTLPLLADAASLVVVGSAVATAGMPYGAHYTAAKAGLSGLVRSLCKELGPQGHRVNLVAPGLIETDMASGMTPEKRKHYEQLTSLGRLGEPAEVAGPVLFLLSDAARYVSGTTLLVNGGI